MGAMKCWVAGIFAACMCAAGHAYADDGGASAPVWNWTYDSEPQFVSWSASRGWPNNVVGSGHGSQFYVPFGVSTTGTPLNNWNFQVDVHGGYVWASQSVGSFSGSVSTATDTTVSTTTTYTGFNGFQPYLSVMANLPTGESMLTGTHTWARMDPDLVPVAVYGEGLNVGPTIGLTIPVNSELAVVVNGGYTWRGKYWKEGGFDPTTMTTMAPQLTDPSGVWTGAATATWTHGALTLQSTASYAVETTNYVDNVAAYRTGPRTTISGSGSYLWDDHWSTSVDGYWVHIDKNDIPAAIAPFGLTPEMLDSNNNIFRINASQMYKTPFQNGTLTVGPVGSFMYRENNSWDSTSFSFVPAKTRYSVGASGTYAPNDKANVSLRLEHIWINEDNQPAAGIPTVNGQGWQGMLALTLNTP